MICSATGGRMLSCHLTVSALPVPFGQLVRTTRDFLARNHIPYQWLDIEQDSNALALVESSQRRHTNCLSFSFLTGTVMLQPDPPSFGGKVGLQTQATEDVFMI